MIINEKWMHPPPPPYYRSPPPAFSETPAGTSSNVWTKPNFSSLSQHLLLQIVYSTFPQSDGRYEGEGKVERQRLNLHWLETSLRLVNKALYTACMHILRSTYLPAYESLIRAPYTSDPFSSTSPSNSGEITHRELAALDLFIALLAHENLLLDATSLHLPREEAYKDLFDMVQPRSRLEDIVLQEGVKAGLVYFGNAPPEIEPQQDPEPVLLAPPAVIDQSPNPYVASTKPVSPQPSPSPTKVSFNPFSRSSYISLAKSKMRRMSHSTSTPPSPSTPTLTTEDNDCSPSSPIGNTAFSPGPSGSTKRRVKPLPFEALSVSFSPRRVALVYTPSVSSSTTNGAAGPYNGSTFGALSVSVTGQTKKTLVEVVRARDEPLEVTARILIKGLEDVLVSDGRDS